MQFVVGYGETGNHLVTHPKVGKVIFVGSPGVGAKVMEAAAKNLTPVVLELGGKDPFVVCEDTDIDALVQVACRGVWQNMGQNCAGPERFFVYEGCYDEFCDKVTKLVKTMKQGPPLASDTTDCGAICMGRKQMQHYQNLVDDATKKGAKVLSGGFLPSGKDPLASGSFYPPTVLADVPESADIAQLEIFGPIMCIFKVKGDSDDEAVRMANNCDFALSSCAFSKSFARAKGVADRLDAGMSAVNDLEGVTYMSPSRCPSAAASRAASTASRGPRVFAASATSAPCAATASPSSTTALRRPCSTLPTAGAPSSRRASSRCSTRRPFWPSSRASSKSSRRPWASGKPNRCVWRKG